MKLTIYYKHFPATDGPFDGGVSKAIHGLATGLHRAGASVTVISELSKPISRVSQSGYVQRAFAFRAPNQSFHLGVELKRFLSEVEPENLFLLNGIFGPQNFSVGRLLSRRGVPYIVAPHEVYNSAMFRKSALRKHFYWDAFERCLLQRASAVQVLDERHGLFLKERGIKTPVIEVQNGVEPAEVALSMNVSSVPGDSDIVNFYYLGRIDAYNKGLDLLLEAFAAFGRTKPVRLTLQGPGESEAKDLLCRAKRLGVGDRVAYLLPDFVTSKSTLMAKYDVFCLPSRHAGFNLAALEAMLAARPLLVTAIDGVASHVDASKAGVVVDSSYESILAGLERLWADRATWASMGARGRQRVQTHLQWDSIARSALVAYKGIVPV